LDPGVLLAIVIQKNVKLCVDVVLIIHPSSAYVGCSILINSDSSTLKLYEIYYPTSFGTQL
jgi:hypothetical protein